jgi:hypothetical protein
MLCPVSLEGRAKNEVLFREVNERIHEVAEGSKSDFICECADIACTQAVFLTLADYEAVRSVPANFVVADGHQDQRLEAIVRSEDGYLIVEKTVPLPAES